MMISRVAFPIALEVRPGRGASTRLHHQLREAILDGRLTAGFRLPASRDAAAVLGVARATIVLAYDMLAADGYVRARQGDGTFVQALPRRNAPRSPKLAVAQAPIGLQRPAIDLRLGVPDTSSFPFDIWRRLEARAWREVARGYSGILDTAGLQRLREAIVSHVSISRAVSCTADDVVVTAGAQQAFDLLARTLIAPGGGKVAVESPGYTPAREAFRRAGAAVAGVPVDSEGIVVAALPDDAEVICVTPSHQFPLGVAMSPARRLALLDHARRHDAWIVEDDYDSEYRYDNRPFDALQTLAPDRVCYVGTFSKTMFPALRQGYAIVPAILRQRLIELRAITDGFPAPAPQLALADFIAEGHLSRHVRRMQRRYGSRRDALVDGLRAKLGDRIDILPSKAGLHFSFYIAGDVNWEQIKQQARELDIALDWNASSNLDDRIDNIQPVGFGQLRNNQVNDAVNHLASLFKRGCCSPTQTAPRRHSYWRE